VGKKKNKKTPTLAGVMAPILKLGELLNGILLLYRQYL
jgi:hypothetical protein